MLKRLGKALLAFVAVLAGLGLLLLVGAVVKIGLYEQVDNEDFLASKQAYLDNLREQPRDAPAARPNILFVLYDDLGYGDLSSTGSRIIETPSIDALASNGVLLTRFYSPAPVCTPARFGYLTGRFAERAGMSHVVFPSGSPFDRFIRLSGRNVRIPAHEILLPEILKASGYRTGMVGKWHLGDHSPSLPNDLGFDSFYGSLYSNDMEPFALYRDRDIEEPAPADQTLLSERYTEEAVRFINSGSEQPFFLYLAHNFPHIPLFVRDSRKGKSPAGLYGDVMTELDEGIGAIVAALKASGAYENTLVIITSDNGPWYQGDPGDFRGRKGETFEGGMHVPFIAHWPGKICRGCELPGLAMGTDLVPTVLDLLELAPPPDRRLDGKSLLTMLESGGDSPHDYLYYFSGELYGVRDDRFKYMPRRAVPYPTAGAIVSPGMKRGPWLFDLEADPRESFDTSLHNPGVMKRFEGRFDAAAQAMRDNPMGAVR